MQVGPYEIRGELGRGGMGVVYRARHTELGHDVALKLLAPSAGSSGGRGGVPGTRSGDSGAPAELSQRRWIERFRREAQAAGRLGTHDGIVGVLDVGEDQGRLYLAMQLIEGHALDEELRGRVLEVPEAFRLVAAVARAVGYAHSQGIIHRDLKPGNILVETGTGQEPACPRVWVTDFGLAARTALDAESQKITRTNDVVGTPAYLAPEQLRGEAVDARTDIHALGCTLYELLTGATPFESEWLPVTCRRVLQDVPPPPSAARPGVGPGADAVVLRCLAKDPALRYATAEALAEDCERVARGDAPGTRPSGVGRRAGRWLRARSAVLAGGTALLAVAAGLAWYAAAGGGDPVRARTLTDTQREGATAAQAAGIAAAFGRLRLETRDAMRLLEDRWHGAPVDAAALAAARAQLRRAAAAHGAPFADAWAQLGEFYAGTEEPALAALDALAQQAQADPVPAALLARARLEHLLRWNLLPMPAIRGTVVRITMSTDAGETSPERQAVEAALARARTQRTWSRLGGTSRLQAYLDAAHDVVCGRLETARPVIADVCDDPFLGGSARRLLAVTMLVAGDYDGAADQWSALHASRGWRDALRGELDACTLALADAGRAADHAAWRTRAAGLAERLQTGPVRGADLVAVARLRLVESVARWRSGTPIAEAFAPPLELLRASIERFDGYGALSLHRLLSDLNRQPAASAAQARAWAGEARALRPVLVRTLTRERAPLEIEADLRVLELASPPAPLSSFDAVVERAVVLWEADRSSALRASAAADALIVRGKMQTLRGGDGAADFAQAADVLTEAVRRWPGFQQFRQQLVRLHIRWADWAAATGRRADEQFARAKTAADAFVAAFPEDPQARAHRSRLLHTWAEWAHRQGAATDEPWAACLADIDAAIRLQPEELALYEQRAISRLTWGQRRIERGGDPGTLFAGAEADFERVTATGVMGPEVYLHVGRLFRFRAERAWAAGRDPRRLFAGATHAFDLAVESRPKFSEAYFNRGNLFLRVAQYTIQRNGDPADLLHRAIADYDTALTIQPADADLLANRGAAKATLGDAFHVRGRDAEPIWLEAITDLQAAAAINPRLWQLHVNAAMLHEGMQRWEAALAAYDAALAINPDAQRVAAMAAALRKRLGK